MFVMLDSLLGLALKAVKKKEREGNLSGFTSRKKREQWVIFVFERNYFLVNSAIV
ncbi:MAG: hypothetical protein ACJA1Z_001105 [Patiriisocius sp.]|jgi:hypothetical protein